MLRVEAKYKQVVHGPGAYSYGRVLDIHPRIPNLVHLHELVHVGEVNGNL